MSSVSFVGGNIGGFVVGSVVILPNKYPDKTPSDSPNSSDISPHPSYQLPGLTDRIDTTNPSLLDPLENLASCDFKTLVKFGKMELNGVLMLGVGGGGGGHRWVGWYGSSHLINFTQTKHNPTVFLPLYNPQTDF